MDTPTHTALSRLCRDHLPDLRRFTLGALGYTPRIGIVHLGLGSFHRAHQALYTEQAMLADGGHWAICGATLRNQPAMQAALARQEGLYSVLIRDGAGERIVVAQALHEVLVAPRQRTALLARLCHPDTRIVTLTVTEKGYCYDPATGGLDFSHPLVQTDLQQPHAPQSVPGYLVAALAARRANPFTVLSCDNLAHNGRLLRQVVVDFARALDPELADWIAESVAFPSSMVDRITPGTTEADRTAAARALEHEDAWPVPCEAFSQWVIEDHFPAGRPRWEAAGALLVDDVAPYERTKLRMLNGTHSTLAYLSMLAGFETVDEAIGDADLHALIRAMMTEEIAPTLEMPATFDTLAYRDQLLARYANPALKHRAAQIAMDGSLKLPPRLLGTVAQRLSARQPFRRHALAIAAWMRFLLGRSDAGVAFEISDPMSARLKALAAQSRGDGAALLHAMLGVREVFPAALAESAVFCAEVGAALQALAWGCARGAIAQYR